MANEIDTYTCHTDLMKQYRAHVYRIHTERIHCDLRVVKNFTISNGNYKPTRSGKV